MRYRGTAYPILKTTRGYFCSSDDISQIKADMLTILMTRPGERIMELQFGTPFNTLNLGQPMELMVEEARQMIATALKIWEKRVQVTSVDVLFVDRADLKAGYDINIQVSFIDPVNLQEEHLLTLQIPLDGGNHGR